MSTLRQALLVFARAPEVGKAKTRLIPALGAEGAAALHAGLVERTLQTGCGHDFDVQLWCHPDPQHPFFRYCADRFGVSLHCQQGGDLGERMALALASALTRHGHAVLIGTDCPTLEATGLADAFAALAGGADAVFGPAADGGYYLVGLQQPAPTLFAGVDWGSDRVLAQTQARARALGLDTRLLTTHGDLDTPADLQAFHNCSAVMKRGQELVGLDR
jgi:rSAM/selenodomain-associated transferase 1